MFDKINDLKHQDVAEQQFWNKIVTPNKIIELTDPAMLEATSQTQIGYCSGPQTKS